MLDHLPIRMHRKASRMEPWAAQLIWILKGNRTCQNDERRNRWPTVETMNPGKTCFSMLSNYIYIHDIHLKGK